MACHSSCKDYKDWKTEHDNRKAEVMARETVNYQLRASKIEFISEYRRRTKCKK
jgi:hypothetical protein